MLRLVRPGGVVAVQEPDASCWNAAPLNPSWSTLKAAILDAFRAGGGDFNAGCRTFGMLRGAGLQQVSQRNAVLAATGIIPTSGSPCCSPPHCENAYSTAACCRKLSWRLACPTSLSSRTILAQ